MNEFWYQIENKNVGPVSFSELQSLEKQGVINHQTKCWKEGMKNWETFSYVANSHIILETRTPSEKSKVTEIKVAGVWRRYFARSFDTYYESLAVSFALGFLLAQFWHDFPKYMAIPGSWAWFWMFCLPFVLVLDSLIYRLFGNTPGKMWLGLNVVNEENGKVSAKDYLRRNFSLWRWGFAFGFPFITYLALLYQGNQISKGHQATHDRFRGTRVLHIAKGWFRDASFVLGVLAIILFESIAKFFMPLLRNG